MNPTKNTPTTPSQTNPTSSPSESSGFLNIQPGKFYRTRGGRKYENLKKDVLMPSLNIGMVGLIYDSDGSASIATHFHDGTYHRGIETDRDLIAEWSERPEIDWSKMPAWAAAYSVGAAGVWLWFENKPIRSEFGWEAVGRYGSIPSKYAPTDWSGDWRDSLVNREGEV